jgi:hypothetical protein
MTISSTIKEALMPFGSPSGRYGVLLGTVAAVLFVFALLPSNVSAVPELVVRVSDTTGSSCQQNSVISVYITNITDSIAGFSLWLRLDRPDIMKFQIDTVLVSDTTYWKCLTYAGQDCIDSVSIPKDSLGQPNTFFRVNDTLVTIGNIDRTGSLIANWDLVNTRSISGTGYDILVTGLASFDITPPVFPPPFPPRQQEALLFRLRADILCISDTTTDRTVRIMVESDFLDKFVFARPNGTAIGLYNTIVPDTVCWQCITWVGGNCIDSTKSTFPPCDWTTIEQDSVPTLDTNKVFIYEGSLTVNAGCCIGSTGNVNKSVLETPDLSDLSLLIAYLTQSPRPTLQCEKEANVNALSTVDLSDLSLLISYLTQTPRPTLPVCP